MCKFRREKNKQVSDVFNIKTALQSQGETEMTLQKFQKQYFLEDYAENIEVSKMRIIKKKEPDEEQQNKVHIKKGINKSPWNNLLANFSGTI